MHVDEDKILYDQIGRLKSEDAGIEYDTDELDEPDETNEKPFEAEKIRVDQQMLSVKYMLELMDQNLIELNPGYQRHYVWKENKRKSLLIESLMLRIPIPAFYFYENEDGIYQVIDGQQRLNTIKEFVDGKFALSGLEYLGEQYNKKRFKDIDIKYVQRIYRTQIAVNILDARSPKKVIYDIFRRVNTGGVNLNPQEMRNAICKQEVRDLLRACTLKQSYKQATRNRIKDIRLDAQELVLRFFAFYMLYDYTRDSLKYEYSNIATMLDDAIEKLNKMSGSMRSSIAEQFDEAMKRAYAAFGEYAFSKISKCQNGRDVERSMDVINKSLFSSFSVLLLRPQYDSFNFMAHKKDILCTLALALEEKLYVDSITAGTGNKKNIHINFSYSREVLDKCLS